MSVADNHLADETLSQLLDDRLPATERATAQAHVHGCLACRQRADELQSVVELLRSLPELEPPRRFSVGPRLVSASPRVVRLERVYLWTRVVGASLAAMFVVLIGATALVDATAPAPAAQPAAAVRPQRAEAPQSLPSVVPSRAALPPAAAPRPTPPEAVPSTDQVAATTSVQALPTAIPTPASPPRPVSGAEPTLTGTRDSPLRLGATVIGGLAILILLAALIARQRLRAVAHSLE